MRVRRRFWANLEELQLGLALRDTVVVAVHSGKPLLHGRLLHLVQDGHGQVVLQAEVRLAVELKVKVKPNTTHFNIYY